MNWLNINTTSLRSPEFISSEPVERATWLCVLSYSAEQENGGRVLGAALWSDRQWQQTCGVTLAEVRQTTRLLLIEGDDVLVAFYPREQEKKQQNNRRKASAGGLKSAAVRALKRQSAGQPASPASSLASTPASTERNRKEKEGNIAQAQALPSTEEATPEPQLQETTGDAAHACGTSPILEVMSAEDRPPGTGTEATASATILFPLATSPGSGHHAATAQPRRAGIFPGLVCADLAPAELECEDAGSEGGETSSLQALPPPLGLDEVLAYARAKGHPERIATYWLKRREAAGWRFPNGGPIHNWHSDLDGWVMEEMRRRPDTCKAAKAPAASAHLRSTIDPAAWARWASTFSSPPPLETASDRLVERFRRETALAA